MKLYCDPISTTTRPVLLFAAEAGIELERVHVDLMSHENRAPAYLAVNPNGVVPFLVDGDVTLGESTAILRYLADRIGSPAYPRDLKARAKVDEALGWFSTNLHEYFCLFAIYPNFGIPHGIDPTLAQAMIAYGEEHAPRWLQVLDRHMIGARPFVCGDQPTLADYLGSAFITLGEAAAYDFGPYPNIRRWIANMKALASWNEAYAGFNGFVAAMQSQSQITA
ncbi:MAG TPA: glutathione S-transferase family protein [Phenylobacterium sp.]|nr:glutathione S-transferase family protein [Phenylobacterium sp.]